MSIPSVPLTPYQIQLDRMQEELLAEQEYLVNELANARRILNDPKLACFHSREKYRLKKMLSCYSTSAEALRDISENTTKQVDRYFLEKRFPGHDVEHRPFTKIQALSKPDMKVSTRLQPSQGLGLRQAKVKNSKGRKRHVWTEEETKLFGLANAKHKGEIQKIQKELEDAGHKFTLRQIKSKKKTLVIGNQTK